MRAGDVIKIVDGGVHVANCSALFACIMEDKLPDLTLRLTVLRDRDTLEVTLPVVE